MTSVGNGLVWLILLFVVALGYGKPTTKTILSDRKQFMMDYLRRYGYLHDGDSTIDQEVTLLKALNEFSREMFDHGYDGDEDQEQEIYTIMNQPRCTNDKPRALKRRSKRYVKNDYKWQFTDITWKFHDPKKLFVKKRHFQLARRTVARAFRLWGAASHGVLLFREVQPWSNETADIDLYFARYDHNDFEAFDGTGGIVAHSGYPMDGQVHFDASESWTINGKRGVDFRYASTHEIGHALGLRHSRDAHSVMNPVYRRQAALALAEDDVLGIRDLYSRSIAKVDAIRRAKKRYEERLRLAQKSRRNVPK